MIVIGHNQATDFAKETWMINRLWNQNRFQTPALANVCMKKKVHAISTLFIKKYYKRKELFLNW